MTTISTVLECSHIRTTEFPSVVSTISKSGGRENDRGPARRTRPSHERPIIQSPAGESMHAPSRDGRNETAQKPLSSSTPWTDRVSVTLALGAEWARAKPQPDERWTRRRQRPTRCGLHG